MLYLSMTDLALTTLVYKYQQEFGYNKMVGKDEVLNCNTI